MLLALLLLTANATTTSSTAAAKGPKSATATASATTSAAAAPVITLPVLPTGRPDLWDQYASAQKANTERDAADVARAYGFASVEQMSTWEREAQAVAAREGTRGARATGLVALVVDAPSAHITSGYGIRVDPMSDGLSTHSGIDIGAPYGSAIFAIAPGRVTQATYDDGYGFMVEIEHKDGTKSRYCHASSLLVERGRDVVAGEKVALVGSTGRSTGSHVHFEVRRNGVPINPSDAVRAYLREADRAGGEGAVADAREGRAPPRTSSSSSSSSHHNRRR